MGCDIHTYLEFSRDGERWECFAEGPAGGRDYAMFGVLAGVRYPDVQKFHPKGRPDKLSWQAEREAWLTINDKYQDQEGYCSLARAQSWGTEIIINKEGEPWRVAHPDLHSHSWLTTDEMAEALAHYMFHVPTDYQPYSVQWDAVLAAMRAFEERGFKARLVFWFDN